MPATAEISSIVRRGDATVLVSVTLSNGTERERFEFILLDELFLSLGIDVGEINCELLSSFDSQSNITAAYMSACSSFAYVQSSLKALYLKLLRKGFSRNASLEAIEIIRKRGFVDEDQIAWRRAELMLKKLWGRSRILCKLREEGFPDSSLDAVSDRFEDLDFSENCAHVIEKKYARVPEDRREREKMYASLLRLGYSSSEIKSAVKHLSNSE